MKMQQAKSDQPIPSRAISRKVNSNGQSTKLTQLAHAIGPAFEAKAAAHDQSDSFVQENYLTLKEHQIFSAIIPKELGGLGKSYSELTQFLRIIAGYCGSTALALSMHQHLIAANVWKYKNNKGGEAILRKVAKEQCVLISTGARDWLASNGSMKKVEGGYLVSAHKAFASQSGHGGILVTSARYNDPNTGTRVLHFPVPIEAEGVKVLDNWYTMGMRGTGSQSVLFEDVFVPDTAIALDRPQGEYHMVYNVVLGVAMPLIMSVYTGIAEKAFQLVTSQIKPSAQKEVIAFQLGELFNFLRTATVTIDDMVRLTNELDFIPSKQLSNEMLSRKTIVANAAKQSVGKAMEIAGGPGFYRSFGLERLFRDVQAANYHPLPEKEQQFFTGEFLLQSTK